jgi:arylformamidase
MRPLYSLQRDGVTEIVVYGEITVVDAKSTLFKSQPEPGSYPARSVLKPFQFLTAGLPKDAWVGSQAGRFVACTGSISGTEEQVKALQYWYGDETSKERIPKIKFTPTYPMDEKLRVALKSRGEKPNVFHHTCFSKHMAILESCAMNGWPEADYNSPAHPFHTRLMSTLSYLVGEELEKVPVVVDGCTLPSPVLGMERLARLYQRLAAPKEGTRLKGIQELMLSSPDWVGGPGRVDTKLMEANAGQVVAKEGADGLTAIAVLPSSRFPQGLGIILKTAAGYQPPLAAIALAPVLEWAGLKTVHEIPRGQTVQFHYDPKTSVDSSILDISPVIRENTVVWPEDVGFQRKTSCDTNQGDHMTLSAISTTVHLGAHTDAPNHFEPNAIGIDKVPLDIYYGSCRVVEVNPKGRVILPSDLEGKPIDAPRILFKTGTFPDWTKFNRDFVALSPEVITWLAARQVKLVGIDTPSIDPFESKTMSAHHACTRYAVSILEGIDLKSAPEGRYQLVSLPLPLADCDASPVRAVLIRE